MKTKHTRTVMTAETVKPLHRLKSDLDNLKPHQERL
jgi:hypothetical protein